MPSVFSLEGPFGLTIEQIGTTTSAQLDLLTNTPEKTLAILKEMSAFLGIGAGKNLPILVSNPTDTYQIKMKKFRKGLQMISGVNVDLPFSFLGISHDTYKLWDHALKRSGMHGGFAFSGIPDRYNLPIAGQRFNDQVTLTLIGEQFPSFIGHAGNQLAGIAVHTKRVAAAIAPDDTKKRNIAIGIGVAALLVGGVVFVATRD